MRSALIACALLLAALPATGRTAGIEHYTASAYTPDGRRLLYREQHYRYRHDGHAVHLVLYTCPGGKAFARKTVTGGSAQAPDFRFVDALAGYREGVRQSDGQRTVYVKRSSGDAARTRTLPTVPDAVIDMGFDTYVRRHWTSLVAGTPAHLRFLVPSHLKYYRFVVARTHADPAQLTLRLHVDSWLAFALPHIDVTYDRATRTLRRFRGLSNVRDARGRNVKVQVRLPPASARGPVPPAALQKSRNAPLDGRCSLR